jgi:hypothetical protein
MVSPLKSWARQEFALVKNRGTLALLADAQMSTVKGPSKVPEDLKLRVVEDPGTWWRA